MLRMCCRLAGDEEELLRQAQLLALHAVVVGIKNLGDVLRRHFVGDGAKKIADD